MRLGNPLDALDIPVNVFTDYDQVYPSVAMDAAGDFVVTWTSYGPGPHQDGIFAKLYDGQALPVVAGVRSQDGDPLSSQTPVTYPITSLTIQFSQSMSEDGGATGTASVTNPANYRLLVGATDISSSISGISYAFNATTGLYEATLALSSSLLSGDYQVIARGSLRAANGSRLDGDQDAQPGGDYALHFTIALNAAPTDIGLDVSSVPENQPLDTLVGTLATSDPNIGDTFTYTLVGGIGSTDNGSFAIVGNQLQTAAIFDFETKATYTIRVRSTDQGGLYTELPLVILVTNVNELPTANAGGPYAIGEGFSLVLDGSGSSDPDFDPLTYSWDVNGDGTFDDATGVAPTLSWAQLVALGITDGPAALSNVRVRVDDGQGNVVDSPPTTLTVNNAPPVAGISGPTTVLRGELQNYMLTTTDPSPADQAEPFVFLIEWGDGSAAQMITGVSGTIVPHRFDAAGPHTVSVTATDQNGGTSSPATVGVQVDAVQFRPNAQNPALVDLVWGGTAGADRVEFIETSGTTVRVHETLLNGAAVDITQDFTGITGRVLAMAMPATTCSMPRD